MSKLFKLITRLGEKFIAGNKNIVKLKRGGHLKPKWLWLELTDNCNSRCRHCQIWRKQPTADQLSPAELRNLFVQPLLSDVETIINSGGEMFLRNDILEIIKLEHEIFPAATINFSTNGILADKALTVIKEALAAGIKINPCVSLDGLYGRHDAVRGVEGNFRQADYLIRELVELRKKYPEQMLIAVGFTLSDLTLDQWRDVKAYARALGVEFVAQWYNESSFYENSGLGVEARPELMLEAVKAQPNTIIREKWLKLLNNKPIKFNCRSGETFFALRCDGSVVPCLTHWNEVMGNVRRQSLEEIWLSESAEAVRNKIKACPGCLNTWGVEWSATTSFYPRLWFYLRHPLAVIERLKRRD